MFASDCFGLDIGSNTIKVSQLNRAVVGYKIAGQNIVDTVENPITKNGIKQIEVVALDLKNALENAKPKPITTKNFYTCLPESIIFTKLVSFPTTKDNEIRKMVNYQIIEAFPLPLDELYTDYKIQAKVKKNSIVQIEAAPRKIIDDFVKLADLAKLYILGIETKPISLVRIMADPQKNGLIIDIGAQQVSLILVMKGLIRMTSTAPFGVEKINDQTKLIKQIAREINSFINFFTSKTKIRIPDLEILLTGGGTRVGNTVQDLAKITGIGTKEASPLYRIQPYHPRFSASLSLALKKYYE